jgi:hypothetical protein
LADPSSLQSVLKCFVSAKANSFENLLDPLLKIVRTSTAVAIGLARPEFFQRLTDKLQHHKAVVRLNLLRLLKAVCDIHPDRATLVERFGLYNVVERLSRTDGAVLVRELARDIVPVLLPGRLHSNGTSRPVLEKANRSSGTLLDVFPLDGHAKSRRIVPKAAEAPPVLARKVIRRAASETNSPPLGVSRSSPTNSLIGDTSTAKRIRPIPVQRRSARDVNLMLDSGTTGQPSIRSAISSEVIAPSSLGARRAKAYSMIGPPRP